MRICQLLLAVLAAQECRGLTLQSVRSECVVAKTLEAVLRPLRPTRDAANAVVEVKSFSATDSDGRSYCGLLPLERYDARTGDHLEGAAALPSSAGSLPLALLTALAAAARGRTSAIVLGGGASAKLAQAAFAALDVEALVVPPADAAELEPARSGTLYCDLAGSERIRSADYLSLLSPAANAAIDNGIFADLDVTPLADDYALDVDAAATLLRSVLSKLDAHEYEPNKGSFLTPPVLRRDARAVDEYADFLAWGRDADNRGRRLGLDRFYDDGAMRNLLEEGTHENLLDKIHTVEQAGLGLHQAAKEPSDQQNAVESVLG